MGWGAEYYRDQLKSLLPKGKFWTRAISSILHQILYGKADELARVDTRSDDLIQEAFTLRADETLSEHELDFGIDTEDIQVITSDSERRNQINAKLVATGGQSKKYFEGIADSLGYDIVIYEPRPAWTGIVAVGDGVGDQYILFKWVVYVLLDNLVESRQVNISRLYYEINLRKPAHTQMFMDFYGAAFSREFNMAFDRIPYYDNSWLELDFGRELDDSFANAYDYDGIYLTGAFDKDFGIGLDRNPGGAFSYDDFGDGYNKII